MATTGQGNADIAQIAPALFGQQPSVPDAPSMGDIEVAPERLLDVAKVLEDQAGELMRKISEHLSALNIEPPASDAVSTHAVDAWNEVIAAGEGSYQWQVREYVRQLRALAEQLRAASEKYQVSEDDKRATFDDRRGFEI